MKCTVKIEIVNEIIKLNTCRILDRIIEEWNEKKTVSHGCLVFMLIG